ncbi:response regulator, partial [Lysobacter antibioticus]|uniref:response regulator n=1 Tax=Lysobacter antibioticus TaxID=84531 RepID=UPI00055F26F5
MLIVDDDAMITEIISALLMSAGCESFDTEASGIDALERLAAGPFELMICDLNMPHMDGIHLMSQVASLS